MSRKEAITRVLSTIAFSFVVLLWFHEKKNHLPRRLRRQLSMIDPRTVITKTEKTGSLLVPSRYPHNNNNNNSRVIVLTAWTHYPEMLELHVASLSAFLLHPVMEYICILNSPIPETNQELMIMAEKLNVTHLTVPQNESPQDFSRHHANALHQALHHFMLLEDSAPPIQIQSDDILWLLDSDMFLLQPTSLHAILNYGEYSIATVEQSRVFVSSSSSNSNRQKQQLEYLWPNLAILQFPNPAAYHELGFYPVTLQIGNNSDERVHLDSGGESHFFFTRAKKANQTRGMHQIDYCQQQQKNGEMIPTKSNWYSWFKEQQQRHQERNNNNNNKQYNPCAEPALFGFDHSCKDIIYHMGSAGSNWRNCPEEHLYQQRMDLRNYLVHEIELFSGRNDS